jgi:hypothetical protein
MHNSQLFSRDIQNAEAVVDYLTPNLIALRWTFSDLVKEVPLAERGDERS